MSETGELPSTENLQQDVEKVWENYDAWQEGGERPYKELREGIRVVTNETSFYAVIRILAPNAPHNKVEGKPDDIPIAIVDIDTPEEEINRIALKYGRAIINGEIDTEKAYEPEQKKRAA